jgi:hypothetical protein
LLDQQRVIGCRLDGQVVLEFVGRGERNVSGHVLEGSVVAKVSGHVLEGSVVAKVQPNAAPFGPHVLVKVDAEDVVRVATR